MTIREWAENLCYQRGMFPDQAKAVIAQVEAENEPMAGRWDQPQTDCPPQVLAVLRLTIDETAVRWIDANVPRAWYRPLFADRTTNHSP